MSCKDNSIRANNTSDVEGFLGESFTDSKAYSFLSAKDIQVVISVLTLIVALIALRK